jgi:hypothetical protein
MTKEDQVVTVGEYQQLASEESDSDEEHQSEIETLREDVARLAQQTRSNETALVMAFAFLLIMIVFASGKMPGGVPQPLPVQQPVQFSTLAVVDGSAWAMATSTDTTITVTWSDGHVGNSLTIPRDRLVAFAAHCYGNDALLTLRTHADYSRDQKPDPNKISFDTGDRLISFKLPCGAKLTPILRQTIDRDVSLADGVKFVCSDLVDFEAQDALRWPYCKYDDLA